MNLEQPMEPGDGQDVPSWQAERRHYERELIERLGFAPLTADIAFVAFLKTFSQFGFFRFGPITIDVDVVEDILMRTHPRGTGGPNYAAAADAVRMWALGWRRLRESGSHRESERDVLMAFLQWGEGLPARVFGELGVSAADVERYIREAASPGRRGGERGGRLLSTDEAAAQLGVHVQTIRAWIRSGKLPAFRLAGMKSIRIRETDLQAVLEPIDPALAED